jgi:hypothetical protein
VLSAADQLPSDRRIKAVLKKPFDLDVPSKLVASLLNAAAGAV